MRVLRVYAEPVGAHVRCRQFIGGGALFAPPPGQDASASVPNMALVGELVMDAQQWRDYRDLLELGAAGNPNWRVEVLDGRGGGG